MDNTVSKDVPKSEHALVTWVVVVVVLGAATVLGAFGVRSARAERSADRTEIIFLESAVNAACDSLAFDLEQTANGVWSISTHDDVRWYAAFTTCVFPREMTDREQNAVLLDFRRTDERLLGQTGADAVATLRDLAGRVKTVRAMPFRRADTPK